MYFAHCFSNKFPYLLIIVCRYTGNLLNFRKVITDNCCLGSQVFDNFFSNAAKYTQEVDDQAGNKIKFISSQRKILKNYFGEGVHGIEFSIFTTGKPIAEKDVVKLFEEGFRSSSATPEQGSGHGLHFIRNVVEIHGGEVGCTPQRYGNEFYFVLPLKEELSWAGGEQQAPGQSG